MKILGFAGSLRKDSFNKKLLQVAMSFAKARNIEIEIFDLENIPIYSYDVQLKGFPKSVINFKTAIKSADLLLIASPEYNYSVSGALKNAIDWASRPEDENVFSNKVAAIFGASVGRFGTVRGQIELRKILTALNVWVIPAPQIMVTFADEAFDEAGNLKDEKTAERLKKLIKKGIVVANKLKEV